MRKDVVLAQQTAEHERGERKALAQAHTAQLKSAASTSSTAADKLRDQVQELHGQVTELEAQRTAARNDLARASADNKSLTARVSGLTTQLEQLDGVRSEALRVAEQQAHEAGAARASAEAAKQQLEMAHDELRRNYDDLHRKMADVERRNSEALNLRSEAEHRIVVAESAQAMAVTLHRSADGAMRAAHDAQGSAAFAARIASQHAARSAHDVQRLLEASMFEMEQMKRQFETLARHVCSNLYSTFDAAQRMSAHIAVRVAQFEMLAKAYSEESPEVLAVDAAWLFKQLIDQAKRQLDDQTLETPQPVRLATSARLLASAASALDTETRARGRAAEDSPARSPEALAACAARAQSLCKARAELKSHAPRADDHDNFDVVATFTAAVEQIDVDDDNFGDPVITRAASPQPQHQQQSGDNDAMNWAANVHKGSADFVEADGNPDRLVQRGFGVVLVQ